VILAPFCGAFKISDLKGINRKVLKGEARRFFTKSNRPSSCESQGSNLTIEQLTIQIAPEILLIHLMTQSH
jgi:hypothetical protein